MYMKSSRIPHPEQIIFIPASVSDLGLFKEAWSGIEGRTFFGDKIYNSRDFFGDMAKMYRSEMLTPIKAVQGIPQVLKDFDRAARSVFKGRIKDKVANRIAVQLADRKG